MSKTAIRKALETRLTTALASSGLKLVTGGATADARHGREYLLTSITYGPDHATEIGRDPRIERSGVFTIHVRTDPGLLDDRNDQVADLVRSAYPYGDDLEHDGIRVNILTVDDSECIAEGSYLYSPVDVNFMVWSINNA